MRHEAQVLQKVTEARNLAMAAKTMGEHAEAENFLSQTLKSLFAVAENYPDLKASQNFLQLQDELTDTENKVQAARRFYNSNVRDYNIKLQQFPNNLLAKTLGFGTREYFESSPGEREVPKVQL
jgi:LemA protein